MEERQWAQKQKHDAKARVREFNVGDKVFSKNFGSGSKWLPGKIVRVSGPVSFHVELEDGKQRRCHQDHLRLREVEESTSEDSLDDVPFPVSTTDRDSEESVVTPAPLDTSPTLSPAEQVEPAVDPQPTIHQYPRRSRKPTDRFHASFN